MSVIHLQYSDAYLGSPQHSRLNSLQHQSTANQPLTSATKKSIPNVHRVIDQSLVKKSIMQEKLKKLWNEVKQSLVLVFKCWEGTHRRPIQVLSSSSPDQKRRSCVQDSNTISHLKLLLLTYWKYFASFSNASNLFLTLLLNEDIVSKDFSVLVKKLFHQRDLLIGITDLPF